MSQYSKVNSIFYDTIFLKEKTQKRLYVKHIRIDFVEIYEFIQIVNCINFSVVLLLDMLLTYSAKINRK
ncbi:hypothetical protein BpHYR1_038095 [Brachionus plicatilis]|uniref:Uncharacterized protein n=1 Tax=Brachionus plicatilis TaxID=10195 RepID=A0A3M7Q4L8_BRAPC|nr:hypothetical protein BpHYR1_038095 [Brachionus plicatilis]